MIAATGRDHSATLSPNGNTVAVVRSTTVPPDGVELADTDIVTELWIMAPDGSHLRRLVAARASNDPRHNLTGTGLYRRPAFSPDGTTIYFLTRAWGSSQALHAVTVASGRERFLIDASDFSVMTRGQFRNDVVVWQHGFDEHDGATDTVGLVSPTGRYLQRISQDAWSDTTELRRFVTRYSTP